MKFFVVSDRLESAGVCVRLRQEGNEVVLYVRDPRSRPALEGMIRKVSSPQAGLALSPDIVIFDGAGMGKLAEKMRKEGWKVFGGGEWNDRLELDRRFATKAFESFGLRTPKSFAFPSLMDAAKFAVSYRGRLVAKFEDRPTYAGKSQDDLIGHIAHLRKNLGVEGSVTLQEQVRGTEVCSEMWYANGMPVPYPNTSLKARGLAYGDAGPATDAAACVTFSYDRKEPRLIQQSFRRMSAFMEKMRYSGPLSIHGIVRGRSLYCLGFKAGISSSIYAWLRTLKADLGKTISDVLGGDASPMDLVQGFGMSLRVSIPPYPCAEPQAPGQIVGGLAKTDWEEAVFPIDVYANKTGIFTAGTSGIVCECTSYSDFSPFEAQEQAEMLFRKIELPNKMARLGDGGRSADRKIQELRDAGYEMPPFIRPVQPVQIKEESKHVLTKEEIARPMGARPGAIADAIHRVPD